MGVRTIRPLILAAFGILLLTLTSVFGEDRLEGWSPHTRVLQNYHEKGQSLRDLLEDLKNRKKELYAPAPVTSQNTIKNTTNRAPSSESYTVTATQADAMATINLEIQAAENKLQRLLKKSDYLLTAKRELTDQEALQKASKDLVFNSQKTEQELKRITLKLEKLTKTCKECRLSPLVPERELASKGKQEKEFHELSQQRIQLEDRLDNYHLREEALRDLNAIAENREPEEHSESPGSRQRGSDSRR